MTVYSHKPYIGKIGKDIIKDRQIISERCIEKTQEDLNKNLMKALEIKGGGTFASVHEIYGSLSEELCEILNAIHNKDIQSVKDELLDLAVVAFWGAASINQKIKDNE